MAHTRSARKSIRIIAEKRSRNRAVISEVKTLIKKVEDLILNNELEPAKAALQEATIALDKAVQRGIIHANNAARHKSRLMKKFNAAFSAES